MFVKTVSKKTVSLEKVNSPELIAVEKSSLQAAKHMKKAIRKKTELYRILLFL